MINIQGAINAVDCVMVLHMLSYRYREYPEAKDIEEAAKHRNAQIYYAKLVLVCASVGTINSRDHAQSLCYCTVLLGDSSSRVFDVIIMDIR
jgi:predicted metallo-beta-lactamase superfamily hydrolase